MMEQDIWNDLLLAGDWSTSLPIDHSDGLFGDLKSGGCLSADSPLGLHLQDAVEHVRSESPSKNEDILGWEWMESSDLGSILDATGSSHDKLLPLEASLIEYTYSMAPEESVTFDEFVAKVDSTKDFQNSEHFTSLENFLSATSVGQVSSVYSYNAFDALSPSSPEQVAPVIKVEAVNSARSSPAATFQPGTFLFDNSFETTIPENNLIIGELDFSPVNCAGDSLITFNDSDDLISSPLSVDDVESMLSITSPSSPSSSCHSSIIESSPELYKIISTSSIENTKRFSPYTKAKPSKQTKAESKKHFSVELVPEHIIGESLSKKDRKKLQNKNAAIRYRMKKKEEAAGIKTDEQILEERNLELRTKVEDLQREIKYMKNLMEDVCRAKGIKG